MLSESVNQSLDEYVAQHLGIGESFMADNPRDVQSSIEDENDVALDWQAEAQRRTKRAAATRLLQDGAMLAWSQRALLGRLLSAKVLGLGGVAAAGFVLAPKALGLYRKRFQPQRGTLQGSPISPLLTNLYMTPFDREMNGQGLRLIRYCDDFIIQCRTEAEAGAALRAAEKALAGRRLKLHPLKTRIVRPEDEFEFLGRQLERLKKAVRGLMKSPEDNVRYYVLCRGCAKGVEVFGGDPLTEARGVYVV